MLRTAERMEQHSAEVRLPRGQAFRFFGHCLRCQGVATHTVPFRSRGRGDLGVLRRGVGWRGLLLLDRVEVNGPSCTRCVPRLRWKQRLHFSGYWVPTWVGFLAYVVARFAGVPNAALGLWAGLGGSALFIVYETFSPPELLVHDRGDTVVFSFRRYDDAKRFAEDNGATVE